MVIHQLLSGMILQVRITQSSPPTPAMPRHATPCQVRIAQERLAEQVDVAERRAHEVPPLDVEVLG